MKKFLFIVVLLSASNSFAQNSWQQAGSISQGNSDWIYSISSDPNGVLYASSWTVGVFRSEDGINWKPAGLNGLRVSRVRTALNNDLYALSKTTTVSYIHKSTNLGANWSDVYAGSYPNNYAGGGDFVFLSDGSMVAAFSVTVGPTIGDVAIFVFKSTDGGNTWIQKHVFNVGFVGGMALLDDGRIIMGTSLAGVIVSSNNGESFSNLGTFPSIFIKTVFQAPDNSIYVSDAYGLNRSTDNGQTFFPTAVVPFASVRDAAANSNSDIYLAMDDRNVYRSTNSGSSWININNGLPGSTYVYSFAERFDTMFGGTNNHGVYYYSSTVTGISGSNSSPGNYYLSQNYPNPFNPVTHLEYGISSSAGGLEFVTLTVYDTQGKVVDVLVNENKSPGYYSVKFDGTKISSGIYFYKIEAGDFTETKRMILLK